MSNIQVTTVSRDAVNDCNKNTTLELSEREAELVEEAINLLERKLDDEYLRRQGLAQSVGLGIMAATQAVTESRYLCREIKRQAMEGRYDLIGTRKFVRPPQAKRAAIYGS